MAFLRVSDPLFFFFSFLFLQWFLSLLLSFSTALWTVMWTVGRASLATACLVVHFGASRQCALSARGHVAAILFCALDLPLVA